MFYPPPIDVEPTVIVGYVEGPTRLENKQGNVSVWSQDSELFFNQQPIMDYAVTHLQKYSKFGFLLTWPFCFHIWYTFRYQEGNDQIGWKPGTEKVFYARTPGYRKDIDYGMVWTWGYCGLRWD